MKTVIEMAKEAGFENLRHQYWDCTTEGIEAFAELARADERAKLAAQQESVASVRTWHKNSDQHAELDDWGLAIALLPDGKHDLYTSPPAQRKPLTNLEGLKLAYNHHWLNNRAGVDAYLLGIRDAEAAHNIKEST